MIDKSVCVCVPMFNGARFIEQQLISILTQLPHNARVLVSDDGSEDDSVSIVRSINDNRIEIVTGPGRGVITNLDHLLRLVTEDYVFLSDQDDVWVDGRYKVMMENLERYDLVSCNALVCDAQLAPIGLTIKEWRKSGPGFLKNIYRNSYVGCTLGFNRKLLSKILPIPKEVSMHDQWIGLIADLNGTTKFLDDIGLKYRRHENNATSLVSATTVQNKIRSRIITLVLVLKRHFIES